MANRHDEGTGRISKPRKRRTRSRHTRDRHSGFAINAKAGVTSAGSFAPSEGFAGVGSTTSGSAYRLTDTQGVPGSTPGANPSPSSTAGATTPTGIPAGVSLHWTSATRHPTKLIPTLGELDVPGKTSSWNHKHLVHSHVRATPAHRRPH